MRILMTILLLSAAASAQMQHIPANRPEHPFSKGVLVEDTFYIAGHIGVDAKTRKPPAKVEDEARAAMDDIKKTLAAGDATMEDLVSVTVYCSDLSTYDAFNAVYREYFKGPLPARAFIGVNKLLLNARFEVVGIAVKRRH
jgi:2-iminobutanoate/2-iminopropanoate deaminase